MPAGRPTKYDPAVIAELDKYLETTGREQTKLPTIEGFSLWLDVNMDTLYEWEKRYPEFSETLARIRRLQKEQLTNDGIYGGKEVNATIVKLLLQNNHGMREKQEITGEDGGPIKVIINPGGGFTPPTGNLERSAPIQGADLASAGTEDINESE